MTDKEIIAEAVARAKQQDDPKLHMVCYLLGEGPLLDAVARHLLDTAPDCVKVPLEGKVK